MGPDTAVYHIDYRAEMQDALARLQDMMNRLQGGRLGKQSIIRVGVARVWVWAGRHKCLLLQLQAT